MSYIGKEPQFTQYPSKFFNGDGTAMTVSLDYAPPNAAALLVFIDGVRQDTSAYTLSGTSLTFTGTVPSGTNNVQVVHLGLTQDVGVPSDDTISTDKLQDDSVTAAKLNATGTPSSSTFLRGDMAWTAVSDTSGLASVQTFTSSGTWTKPAGITKVIVEVQGAGGGSGGSVGASTYVGGDGGGAGGYAKKLIDVSSISSETVTVGTGGSGGSGSGSGSAGGTSSFGSHCSATGGSGGGHNSTTSATGGTATGGDINISGGEGNINYQYNGGAGGNSPFGGAGGGSAIAGSGSSGATNSGSGASAGGYSGSSASGAAGIVIVWEYK